MKFPDIASLEKVSFSYPQQSTSLKNLFLKRNKRKDSNESLLKNIQLKVQTGDRLALMGENGTGKTTIVSLLSGTLRADSGLVKMNQETRVLYSDFMSLMPELQVSDFIRAYLKFLNPYLSSLEISRYMSEIISLSHVKGDLHKKLNHLSFGTRSRLVLAINTATPCQLLILDESFLGVDQGFIDMMKERIDKCLGSRGAMLLISHRGELVDHFCSDGFYLDGRGFLSEKMSVLKVKQCYLNDCSQSSTKH